MSGADRIEAAPHAAFRKLGGEGGGVLLHLRTTAYFQVNELGATIWRIVEDDAPTLERLVERVAEALDDRPAGLEGDVAAFIERLVARDLVQVRRWSE